MRLAIALVGLVIMAAGALVVYHDVQRSVADPTTNVNETFTPDGPNVTTLSDSNLDLALYNETVTVYDSTGGLVEPGGNYSWLQRNGTIKTVNNSDLDSEPSANITYGYALQTEDQRRFGNLMTQLPRLLGLAFPFFGLVLFLIFVRGV